MDNLATVDDTRLVDALRAVWSDVLDMAAVTDDTDFFKSGGHSLRAMLLVSRIERDHGVAVPLYALVGHPTPASLAKYMKEHPAPEKAQLEPFSIDGKETQINYLLQYNNPDKQSLRNESYEIYYSAAMKSAAHAEFCRLVYGTNYGQHGMADTVQLDAMIDRLGIKEGDTVLDVGCGYGLISDYIHRRTGAKVVGIDLSESAISTAKERVGNSDTLQFLVMDLQDLTFPAATFTHIVSIDTIYFTRDLRRTLEQFLVIGRPGVKVAIFRTFPKRSFTRDTWRPELTELASLLTALFGGYDAIDFSAQENQHWARKVEVLESLKSQFDQEGSSALYKFRYDEAAYEASIEQFRYLFLSNAQADAQS